MSNTNNNNKPLEATFKGPPPPHPTETTTKGPPPPKPHEATSSVSNQDTNKETCRSADHQWPASSSKEGMAAEQGPLRRSQKEEQRTMKCNGKLLAELQKAVKLEIARTSSFDHLVSTMNKDLEEKQLEITDLWLRLGCLQREIAKVILGRKKIEACVIKPATAHGAPYSVTSVLCQLITFLRISPDILVRAMRACTDNLKLLSVYLVYGVFCPFAEHDEMLLLMFIKKLMEDQFAQEEFQLRLSILGDLSYVDLVLRSYFKLSGVNEYFILLFGDLVASILQDYSEITLDDSHVQNLAAKFERLITENVSSMPYSFRWIVLQLKQCLQARGFPEQEVASSIGKFIFSHLFERALNKPEYTGYMLFTRNAVTSIARQNMVKIVVCLRKQMESPQYAQYIDPMLVGIEEPAIMFDQALKHSLIYRTERIKCYLSKEAIGIITKPLFILRDEIEHAANPSAVELQLVTMLDKYEEKQAGIERLKDPDALVEFGISLRDELQALGLHKRLDDGEEKNSDPHLKDAMRKLKGIFALPAQIASWDDLDVIETLKRFKITNWKSTTIMAAIDSTIKALQMLPKKYAENDYEKLLKKLKKKTIEELERGYSLQQIDATMNILDVYRKQTNTLREAKDCLLEFFTSQKLARLESVHSIIEKGISSFQKLPKSAPCSCKLFSSSGDKNKCRQCSTRENIMDGIMRQVTNAIETSGMWKNGDADEKLVAEKACERALVDQIPHDILMPNLIQDEEILTKVRGTLPLDAKDCGIGNQLIHGFPYEFAQQEFVRIAKFRSPHDKMWAMYKMFMAIESYITCGGLEAGADERAPVRTYLVYNAYADKNIKLLSHIQYMLLYGYKLPASDRDVLMSFAHYVEQMVEIVGTKRQVVIV